MLPAATRQTTAAKAGEKVTVPALAMEQLLTNEFIRRFYTHLNLIEHQRALLRDAFVVVQRALSLKHCREIPANLSRSRKQG